MAVSVIQSCTYRKCLAASPDKIKNFYNLSIFNLDNKAGMDVSLPLDLATTLVHSMNNRISEVIKRDGDFI